MHHSEWKVLDHGENMPGMVPEHDDQLIHTGIRQGDKLAQHERYAAELEECLGPPTDASSRARCQQHRTNGHAAVETARALEKTAHVSVRSTPSELQPRALHVRRAVQQPPR